MSNPYLEYYTNQAGSGLAGFQGYKYQRGHGFFGNLFNYILKPLGKYFGKQALSTGVAIGQDVLSGENFKESAKKQLKTTGSNVLTDAVGRAKKFAQTGRGKRRRRRKGKVSSKLALLSIKPKSKRRKRVKRKKTTKKKSVKRKSSKRKQRIKFSF